MPTMLVRKITRSKWKSIPEDRNDINSDAITVCCKTSNNTLSLWEISNDSENEWSLIVLAIVSKQDRLDKMDFVSFPSDEFDGKIDVESTPGDTPIESLKSRHKDLVNLTYSKLGIVRDSIIDAITQSRSKMFTVRQIEGILREALEKGLLKKEDLKASLANSL